MTIPFSNFILLQLISGIFVWQSAESFSRPHPCCHHHANPTTSTRLTTPSRRSFAITLKPQDHLLPSIPTTSTCLYGIRCEDKFYQLEEKEDGETSRTEVYLMADRQVDFGKTDGPVPDYVEGTWHVEPGTDDFKMQIRRVFGTGRRGSDMGEFSFEIIRELRGDLTMVGESVAITGVMVNKDELLGDKGKNKGKLAGWKHGIFPIVLTDTNGRITCASFENCHASIEVGYFNMVRCHTLSAGYTYLCTPSLIITMASSLYRLTTRTNENPMPWRAVSSTKLTRPRDCD